MLQEAPSLIPSTSSQVIIKALTTFRWMAMYGFIITSRPKRLKYVHRALQTGRSSNSPCPKYCGILEIEPEIPVQSLLEMKGRHRMSMNLDIAREKGFLRVRLTGEFSLAKANDRLVNVFEAVAQHGLRKVLVDCRQLKGEPTTLERFVHATFAVRQMDRFADTGIFRGTRFAYVGHEPLIDREHFGETVAANRGLNVKVTLTMQEALEWLQSRPQREGHSNHAGSFRMARNRSSQRNRRQRQGIDAYRVAVSCASLPI